MTETERSKLRRLRCYSLSWDSLTAVFDGRMTVELEGGETLPLDAHVVGVNHDVMYRSVVVMIQSDTFDRVPDGDVVPRMEVRARLVPVEGPKFSGGPHVEGWRQRGPMI